MKIRFCEFSSIGVTVFMALEHSRPCTFRPQVFNCWLWKAPVTDSRPADARCLGWSAGGAMAPRLGRSVGEDHAALRLRASARSLAAARRNQTPEQVPKCSERLWLARSPWRGRKTVRLRRLATACVPLLLLQPRAVLSFGLGESSGSTLAHNPPHCRNWSFRSAHQRWVVVCGILTGVQENLSVSFLYKRNKATFCPPPPFILELPIQQFNDCFEIS